MPVSRPYPPGVRRATSADAPALGMMLDTFNREFGSETPGPQVLATRLAELLTESDLHAGVPAQDGTAALIATDGPDATAGAVGFAVLRWRPSLYSPHAEAYLAELYVTPEKRGRGLGRALLQASLDLARELGADRIELGTSETDHAARALYESTGFINTEDGPDGPVMYVYEREL